MWLYNSHKRGITHYFNIWVYVVVQPSKETKESLLENEMDLVSFFITGDCILISKEINQQQSTRDNPICRRVSVYLQWIMVSFLFKDSQKYDIYLYTY